MNRLTVGLIFAVLIGGVGLGQAADSSTNMPTLTSVVEHFKTNGIVMSEAVHFTAERLIDDGFDTLEMIKVLHQDPKQEKVLYSFRLWRQKNIEKTKLRLQMGRHFNWDMTAAGTIVLEWNQGSQKNEVLNAFESFRKQQGLNKTTE
jgi:hypothetical protein